MTTTEKLTELIDAAANSLKRSSQLDSERGAAQVELIIAATGLPEDADSWVVQAIEDRMTIRDAQESYRDSLEKLTARLSA